MPIRPGRRRARTGWGWGRTRGRLLLLLEGAIRNMTLTNFTRPFRHFIVRVVGGEMGGVSVSTMQIFSQFHIRICKCLQGDRS